MKHTMCKMSPSKGAMCSINGKAYEVLVADICKQLKSPKCSEPLNTQSNEALGGCSMKHDMVLNFNEIADTIVEIKGKNVPDWVQCSLIPNASGFWCPKASVLPQPVKSMFESILHNVVVFDGRIPVFSETCAHWEKQAPYFQDQYFDVPSGCIAEAYKHRGVHYIQVFGKGLFHTGDDVCEFGVPMFDCLQRLRVRCKRHGKKCVKTGNHIPSSVMASFRPIYSSLEVSPFSLDDLAKAPTTLMRQQHKRIATV